MSTPVSPSTQVISGAVQQPAAYGVHPLLATLQKRGVVSSVDVALLLRSAENSGESVESVLLKQHKVQREQLGDFLAEAYAVPYVNVARHAVDEGALSLLPADFMQEKHVLPLSVSGGRLLLAMVNPQDRASIDEITFLTGMRPQIHVTALADFQELGGRVFEEGGASELFDKLAQTSKSQEDGSALENSVEAIRQRNEQELSDASNPLVQLVTSVLQEGIVKNASDIHIEPRQGRSVVRFRVDGILKRVVDIPLTMENAFTTRIKVMAKMDIADHRRPQDGRITLKYRNTDYNLRVNTLPVGEGREKIVLRILRPSKQINSFSDLGFTAEETRKLETMYKAPYGIVLVCGPTGSGKTTTLYTVLHQINDDIRNISTIEDPVELRIEGLNQSQVNAKADFTFATSLRALLRQDPDVIMVGEIRDYETLESAIHAALTGHLVFSTIHSNTTAGTITRMLEMGASSNLIASALNGVIAQRLVRSLCPHCKEPYNASEEELQVLFAHHRPANMNGPVQLMRAKGCTHCRDSGYLGRTGIYEIMMMDRELRQLVVRGEPDLVIEDAAVRSGMKTLGMNGRLKILRGQTSFEEVARVLGPNLSGGS